MSHVMTLKPQSNKVQLVPLLASAAIIIAFWNWYFGIVDSNWLLATMMQIEINAKTLGPEEQAVLESMMSPGFLKMSTLTGSLGGLLLTMVIISAIVTLYSRFAFPHGQAVSYKQAFNISTMASLISVSLYLLCCLYVLMSPEQKVNLYQVHFLSLNNLFLSLSPEHRYFSVANSISAETFLFVVSAAGLLNKVSGQPMRQCLLLYILPYLAFWGFIFLIAAI
jgi:hypothetical protein